MLTAAMPVHRRLLLTDAHPYRYLAYIMDTNEEERAKGKTVEVGRATFETTNKRCVVLVHPSHPCLRPSVRQRAPAPAPPF